VLNQSKTGQSFRLECYSFTYGIAIQYCDSGSGVETRLLSAVLHCETVCDHQPAMCQQYGNRLPNGNRASKFCSVFQLSELAATLAITFLTPSLNSFIPCTARRLSVGRLPVQLMPSPVNQGRHVQTRPTSLNVCAQSAFGLQPPLLNVHLSADWSKTKVNSSHAHLRPLDGWSYYVATSMKIHFSWDMTPAWHWISEYFPQCQTVVNHYILNAAHFTDPEKMEHLKRKYARLIVILESENTTDPPSW